MSPDPRFDAGLFLLTLVAIFGVLFLIGAFAERRKAKKCAAETAPLDATASTEAPMPVGSAAFVFCVECRAFRDPKDITQVSDAGFSCWRHQEPKSLALAASGERLPKPGRPGPLVAVNGHVKPASPRDAVNGHDFFDGDDFFDGARF